MEIYTVIVYNKVEDYTMDIVVCAANAFCAGQEAMLTLWQDLELNAFDWEVIDFEIWD